MHNFCPLDDVKKKPLYTNIILQFTKRPQFYPCLAVMDLNYIDVYDIAFEIRFVINLFVGTIALVINTIYNP